MKVDHAFHDLVDRGELTSEALEPYIRRAHLERSRAAHALLRAAVAWVKGWFREGRIATASQRCGDPA
jgi:hypothetical protein